MSSIFSKIIAGEIPGRFVWRDETVVAFLDASPQQYGHTLVVPVAEVDQWVDLPADLAAHVFEVARTIGLAQRAAFGPERIGLVIEGYEVAHAHVKVFPSTSPADFVPANAIKDADPAKQDAAARALRTALRDLGAGEFVPE